MRMKTIAMMIAAGCAASILTGCGVPQEEHDAKIAELNTAWAEIEALKGSVADKESLLKAEQKKVKSARIELDESSKRISGLKEKEAQTASALADEKSKVEELEGNVASAQSAQAAAQDRVGEAEVELANLQEEYQKLQSRFDQFEKNMRSLSGSSAPRKSDPNKSDSETALDLLNEMSVQ